MNQNARIVVFIVHIAGNLRTFLNNQNALSPLLSQLSSANRTRKPTAYNNGIVIAYRDIREFGVSNTHICFILSEPERCFVLYHSHSCVTILPRGNVSNGITTRTEQLKAQNVVKYTTKELRMRNSSLGRNTQKEEV